MQNADKFYSHNLHLLYWRRWVRVKGRNRQNLTVIGWTLNQNICFQLCLNLSSCVICTLAWITDWRGNPWWMANYWLQEPFANWCICCRFVNVIWFLSTPAAPANFSNENTQLFSRTSWRTACLCFLLDTAHGAKCKHIASMVLHFCSTQLCC